MNNAGIYPLSNPKWSDCTLASSPLCSGWCRRHTTVRARLPRRHIRSALKLSPIMSQSTSGNSEPRLAAHVLVDRESPVATGLQVAAFSQLGVLVRVLLGEGLVGVVTSDGVSSSGGAFFKDLPANALGCFVMGLLSATSSLKVVYPNLRMPTDRPLAVLPPGWSLQTNIAAQVGLRTGFCGSLTTFASWKIQMIAMMFGGHGTIVGRQLLAAVFGLIVGTQVALSSLAAGQQTGIMLLRHLDRRTPSASAPQEVELNELNNQVPTETNHEPGKKPLQNASEYVHWSRLSVATTVLFLFATAASLYGAISLAGAPFSRKMCIAVLLGPFGALLRWRLADFNGKLTGSFSWLPIGTFAANMAACTMAFAVHGLSVRLAPLTTSGALLIFAIKSGFCGALSTVSTWSVEVQRMMAKTETIPNAFQYIAMGQIGAILLGVAAYGWAAWV